jgi:hypothetical protein
VLKKTQKKSFKSGERRANFGNPKISTKPNYREWEKEDHTPSHSSLDSPSFQLGMAMATRRRQQLAMAAAARRGRQAAAPDDRAN